MSKIGAFVERKLNTLVQAKKQHPMAYSFTFASALAGIVLVPTAAKVGAERWQAARWPVHSENEPLVRSLGSHQVHDLEQSNPQEVTRLRNLVTPKIVDAGGTRVWADQEAGHVMKMDKHGLELRLNSGPVETLSGIIPDAALSVNARVEKGQTLGTTESQPTLVAPAAGTAITRNVFGVKLKLDTGETLHFRNVQRDDLVHDGERIDVGQPLGVPDGTVKVDLKPTASSD